MILLASLALVSSDIIPTLEIAPGVHMPMLGLGTGPPYSANDTYSAAMNALQKFGYTAIDTAHNYKNQPAIAKAIRDSGVAREKVFITSKVPGSMSYQDTLATNELSLTELNTTYIDLMLVHFPCPSQPYNESKGSKKLRQVQWKAMEDFHRAGKARAIGVSHHCQRHMEDIMEVATVPIAANQVEYHVGMHGGADSQAWMAENNITLLSYLPLCGQCDGSDGFKLINGTMVTNIGKKYGKSGAQVSIRWLIQSGVPAIPRSRNPAYTKEDIDVFSWTLSANDMATLNVAARPLPADGPKADCGIP
jgi:diketogulonate reductase-like aldo/keto reductase